MRRPTRLSRSRNSRTRARSWLAVAAAGCTGGEYQERAAARPESCSTVQAILLRAHHRVAPAYILATSSDRPKRNRPAAPLDGPRVARPHAMLSLRLPKEVPRRGPLPAEAKPGVCQPIGRGLPQPEPGRTGRFRRRTSREPCARWPCISVIGSCAAMGPRRAAKRPVVGRAGLWHPKVWPGLEAGGILARPHWRRGVVRMNRFSPRFADSRPCRRSRSGGVSWSDPSGRSRRRVGRGAARGPPCHARLAAEQQLMLGNRLIDHPPPWGGAALGA